MFTPARPRVSFPTRPFRALLSSLIMMGVLAVPSVANAQPVQLKGSGWMTTPSGAVTPIGDSPRLGSLSSLALNHPIVGMASTTTGHGYWLVASDGGIFAFGDATFRGSTGNLRLNRPIVGMARTPTGGGYWLVASDGGIFSFGDAAFRGSTGNLRLNRPIVGMASTPGGNGYWLVASDGGIFAFGDAVFRGSTGNLRLNQPIVGMAATPSGRGYWLIAADGGVFTFGDAAFHGSLGGRGIAAASLAPTSTGRGYWIYSTDGRIFGFGDAAGATPTGTVAGRVVAAATSTTSAAAGASGAGSLPVRDVAPAAPSGAPAPSAPPATSGGGGGGTAPTTTPTTTAPAPVVVPAGARVVSTVADLRSAISSARPGDTILMRSGTYRGTFWIETHGTATAPITLASYPGEWAVIDGATAETGATIGAGGRHWIFRDFELTDSTPRTAGSRGASLTLEAAGSKAVNLVIHDGETAIGDWRPGYGSQIYGNLIYNAGSGRNSHGIYTMNNPSDPTKRIENNVIANTSGYGIHGYSTYDSISNYLMAGNTIVNAGSLGDATGRPSILVGVETGGGSSRNVVLERNRSYASPGLSRSGVQLHYQVTGNSGLAVRDNYWASESVAFAPKHWSAIGEVTRNTFVSRNGSVVADYTSAAISASGAAIGHNRYFQGTAGGPLRDESGTQRTLAQWQATGRGTGDSVAVGKPRTSTHLEPNRFESGRATVTVFNWDRSPAVSVDLGSVLGRGQRYWVYDATNPLAGPVASGTYDGAAVVPVQGLVPATPLGLARPPVTAPELGVYVVRTVPTWVAPAA